VRSEKSAEVVVRRGNEPVRRPEGLTSAEGLNQRRERNHDLVSRQQQMPLESGGLTERKKGGTLGTNRSVELRAAVRENPDPTQTCLMERCVEPENANLAWKRVAGNKGSPGVDGMSIEEAKGYLRANWLEIREALLKGAYQPKPVKRVEIPKGNGGVRQLGIPTVVDRFIQQLMLQVLQPQWDPTFHEHSFGFRPGRSAHQAIEKAQAFVQGGRRWCVDVDLEKFFDTVNHDVLMSKVEQRVKDKRMLGLIRRFLQAGVMDRGVCLEREEGTPQGGPLSPLLANLLLNEVDWELARRGLAFCRYADDCNVYVRSKAAAERVMRGMATLYAGLRLRINPTKSAVAKAWARKFLGYQLWMGPKRVVKRRVSPQAMAKFKNTVRTLTRRNCGKSMDQIVKGLRPYLLGWSNYFKLADTPRVFAELDSWIRRRLRMVHLKQWKHGETCYRNLVARGLTLAAAKSVAGSHRCYWAVSGTTGMNVVFPNAYFDALGLPRLGG
jgi:RNA-directed DNA polymerase